MRIKTFELVSDLRVKEFLKRYNCRAVVDDHAGTQHKSKSSVSTYGDDYLDESKCLG